MRLLRRRITTTAAAATATMSNRPETVEERHQCQRAGLLEQQASRDDTMRERADRAVAALGVSATENAVVRLSKLASLLDQLGDGLWLCRRAAPEE